MRSGGDERAQSVQVGVVVLFGFLVVAASSYQAVVVPQENAEVEFTHYGESAADVESLRNVMLSVAADGDVRGRTVSTGTGYPVRAFFVNPPPATGTIRTTEESTVAVSGVGGAGDRPNVDRYLSAESNRLTYTTRSVAFDPAYNEFDGAAPIRVENGVVYRGYESPVAATSQTLVDGNRIRLVTVSGDLHAEGLSAGVTVSPVSAHTRTVTVTNRSSDSVNVTVPTDLPESTWEDLLADQLDPDGSHPDRYVRMVTKPEGADYVNVTMEGGEQYELQIARLELDEDPDPDREVSPDARYLVVEGDNRTRTNEDGREKLVVEARDRYNNPVSNAVVTFDASEGSFERANGSSVDRNESADGAQVGTDEDGKATVYFNATGNLGTVPVDASLGTDGASGERATRFHVFNDVVGGDAGSSGGDAGRSLVVLEDSSFDDDGTVSFTLENVGDFPANLTGYRLDYAVVFGQGGSTTQDGPDAIHHVSVVGGDDYPTAESGDRPAAEEGRSPYFLPSARNVTLEGGDTVELTLHFEPDFEYDSNEAGSASVTFYLEGGLTVSVDVFDD